jgi:hypothetical protein
MPSHIESKFYKYFERVLNEAEEHQCVSSLI